MDPGVKVDIPSLLGTGAEHEYRNTGDLAHGRPKRASEI